MKLSTLKIAFALSACLAGISACSTSDDGSIIVPDEIKPACLAEAGCIPGEKTNADVDGDQDEDKNEDVDGDGDGVADADQDGVSDENDKCPDTPKDWVVGKDGCFLTFTVSPAPYFPFQLIDPAYQLSVVDSSSTDTDEVVAANTPLYVQFGLPLTNSS